MVSIFGNSLQIFRFVNDTLDKIGMFPLWRNVKYLV